MNDISGFEILPNKVSSRIIDIKIKNETIEKLILNKDKISEKGFESRKYIEEVHGHIKIAHEYLNVWGN